MTQIATIKETCKCGATFDYSGPPVEAGIAVTRFRAAHMVCRTEAAVQQALR